MASVVSVNSSGTKGTAKAPVGEGRFVENHGLEGDAHAGPWHRQVSLLGLESYAKMEAKGAAGLLPGIFAENLTTEGIDLASLPVGTRLEVGGALLEVTQIGKECHGGCEIRHLVGDCVMPREGIFARVIRGGIVKPGDLIGTMA
jgi:MOSC domain-containing protein YiiM